MSLSNQNIVNQNYIENEDLVSTVDFRVQSAVSWDLFLWPTLQEVARSSLFIEISVPGSL